MPTLRSNADTAKWQPYLELIRIRKGLVFLDRLRSSIAWKLALWHRDS